MEPARPVIRLHWPATRESWEVPVLYEDAHLLALGKPALLLSSPDRYDPQRPNLMRMLLHSVEGGASWVRERGIGYLANVHRLDFETTGVFLLAKDKPSLVTLANLFGSEKPLKLYLALATGVPKEREFSVDARLAPDERRPGRMRWSRSGKRSLTQYRVLEAFAGCSLLECRPLTGRTHQIRVHLQCVGHPILADAVYGGGLLFLSQLKRNFRRKSGEPEKPLIQDLALHAASLTVPHPVTNELVTIEAPLPNEMAVALKYLRKYAARPAGSIASSLG
jgi:RluA family pseudouridine synthase